MVRATRRRVLKIAAAGAALPLVHVRTAGAAGTLSVGFWDHGTPAGNDAMRRLVATWADQTKTSVQVDFITSVGGKNLLTIAAEAQARTGHDVMAFPTWGVRANAHLLEPVDDVIARLEAKHGKTNSVSRYLALVEGAWRAVPSASGSRNKPTCARTGFFARNGVNVQAIAPAADRVGEGYAGWTWDALLDLAPKAQEAGLAFGMPLGQFADAVDWTGSLFAAYGAQLVDETGNVTVKSDAVRQVLEWAKKLVPSLPGDVFSWDDASDGRALADGKSALILSAPDAWAAARRDAPQVAEECWCLPAPAGPAGRFLPHLPYFWGVWSFAANKQAGKDLIEWLSQREQVQALCAATGGLAAPPFESMSDLPVWAEQGPPQGVLYNYPLRPRQQAQAHVAGYPAPPDVAAQIYGQATTTKMIARCTQGGQSIEQVINWAQGELEGFSQ